MTPQGRRSSDATVGGLRTGAYRSVFETAERKERSESSIHLVSESANFKSNRVVSGENVPEDGQNPDESSGATCLEAYVRNAAPEPGREPESYPDSHEP